MSTYRFNNWLQNEFGVGMLISSFGDPDMRWQKTMDRNIGFDMTTLGNRFHANFDYYHKRTNPLIASVGISSSTGVTRRMTNVGSQVDRTIVV